VVKGVHGAQCDWSGGAQARLVGLQPELFPLVLVASEGSACSQDFWGLQAAD
jgi:hypothetical protein